MSLAARYPDLLVHELFEAQVRCAPAATALVCDSHSINYGDLDRKANQLARYLLEKGLGNESVVGVCLERTDELVVGLLGVLKSGSAYLPLDPGNPSARLAYMLEDAAPSVLLTRQGLIERLGLTCTEVISLDSAWDDIASRRTESLAPRPRGLGPGNLAYLIYTSGSTGRPKAVAAHHGGMVNRIYAQQDIDAFRPDDVCCLKTSIGFVDSLFEILGPLSYGRPLVIAPTAATRDLGELSSLIERQRITRLVSVPSLARSLLDSATMTTRLRTLRSWTLSGEELPADLLRRLQEQLPGCHFVNLYGSSEVAADVTYYAPRGIFNDNRVPIGKPIANTQIHILDGTLRPVSTGIPGEIYVAGEGVARGYLNHPDLTAERFVPDSMDPTSHGRLYKTGDLGRRRTDGNIEYLGRLDQQVKIRGIRIEVGEIEARLLHHPLVKEAAVVARGETESARHLVAYVVPKEVLPDNESAQAIEAIQALHAHLKTVLPEYMLPGAFVFLKHFPVTSSGKLDRRALPAPAGDAYLRRPYVQPQGEVEQLLASVWHALLQVEQVGRDDNFFALGGHSLLIVNMLERLRQAGFDAEVSLIYASETLAEMAGALTAEVNQRLEAPPNRIPAGCEHIVPQMLPLVALEQQHIERIADTVPGGPANIQDIYPLTPLQEGILFHYLSDDPRGDSYVLTTLLRFSSHQVLLEWTAAFQRVIDRHDALRTALVWQSLPRPVQVVYRRAVLKVEELSFDPHAEPVECLKLRMRAARQRLELREAPLIRLEVLADERGSQCHALLLLHHIICDQQSLDNLLAETKAHLSGLGHSLVEPVPYRVHIAQTLACSQTQAAEIFFSGKLAEVDEPTAPFGVLEADRHTGRPESIRQCLESSLGVRLRTQARNYGVSAATLFHAVWGLVISRTSGREDVVYGTVLVGRHHGNDGAGHSIGMFINTLPLRLRFNEITVAELVRQTHLELISLLDHEQAPLALAQRCSGVRGTVPLFSAILNYLHDVSWLHPELKAPAGVTVVDSHGGTHYPLSLTVEDDGTGFMLELQADPRIEVRRTLGYLTAGLLSFVEALERTPQTPTRLLSVLPESERHQVLELFNATEAAYPTQELVHQLFEAQARRTPDGVAVICEGRSLTYAELNARANQLARYLRARQIGPDRLVGVCVERSLEMIQGLLGILKAGGAYVPLDPSYPAERLQYMLRDAAPTVLLTQAHLRERLPPSDAEMIALDEQWSEIARQSADDLDTAALGLRSHHLVYVIYTSGSTGRPKGVMVEHRNLTNLVQWHRTALGLMQGQRCSCVAAVGFDAAGLEIWPPLSAGATLFLASSAVTGNVEKLLAWWQGQPLDVSFLPTPIAEIVLSRNIDHTTLRALLIGGDRLRQRSVGRTFSLVDNYGPTEATVVATAGNIHEEDSVLHIGRPIANTQIYILDAYRQPVPLGVVGEIYIGGAGVARGYLNRPELTAERFIKDPFKVDLPAGDSVASCSLAPARLYKTGDLGRWRADGNIEYCGRNDYQVKLRGYRIELGEIENQLTGLAGVGEAVVVMREDSPGDQRLVAYVVPRRASAAQPPLSVESLRAHLQAAVPEYMVPNVFVMLESLPLTPNGKLDRRALPAPELEAYTSRAYEAPEGEIEAALARLWEELLRVERVGRRDHFFELGGHSLLATRVITHIAHVFEVDLPVRALFETPTIEALGKRILQEIAAELATEAP